MKSIISGWDLCFVWIVVQIIRFNQVSYIMICIFKYNFVIKSPILSIFSTIALTFRKCLSSFVKRYNLVLMLTHITLFWTEMMLHLGTYMYRYLSINSFYFSLEIYCSMIYVCNHQKYSIEFSIGRLTAFVFTFPERDQLPI